MVTMRNVAELAGVSITTVSHVLNKTRPVANATVARVLAAVEDTGYTGDAIARSLVTGGTRSIGLALPLTGGPQLTELLRAVDAELTAAGHTLILADTHDQADDEIAAVRALRSRRVDGILLTPSAGAVERVLPELRKAGVPTVLVGRLPEHTGIDQIGPENVRATSDLVRHLGELGHRRIALVTGPDEISTAAERALGYRLGLGRAKLVFDQELVSSTTDPDESVNRLLDLPDAPTAVVAGDGPALVAVLRAARRRNLRIGTDLALVAHEDADWTELFDPPITVTVQPIEQIGRQAVRMLLARISDPEGTPETVRLAPTMVHRRSCGCP